MTPPPNYSHLAKDFLELWQKQMASVVSDKQFLHAMLEMIQTMQMPNAAKQPNATTTAHPADAPRAQHDERAQLAYRLAMCERRLAALEKGNAGAAATKRVAKKPARASKKPRK